MSETGLASADGHRQDSPYMRLAIAAEGIHQKVRDMQNHYGYDVMEIILEGSQLSVKVQSPSGEEITYVNTVPGKGRSRSHDPL